MGKLGKFLGNLTLVFGILLIVIAVTDNSSASVDRALGAGLGIFVCLIAKVHSLRWGLVTLFFLSCTIKCLPVIRDDGGQFDTVWFITMLLSLSITAYFATKTIKALGLKWPNRKPYSQATTSTLSNTLQQAFSSKVSTPNNLPETYIDNVDRSELIQSLIESLSSGTIQNPENDYVVTHKRDRLDAFAQYGGVEAEMLTVDLMDGHDFEYWCANALKAKGFSNVEVTRGSGDQGVDVIAELNGIRYAIQCKRYTSNLGNGPVQEVHAGKYMYGCHVGAVLTNQYFTASAQELARTTGTLLWDRDWIRSYLVQKEQANGVLTTDYSDPMPDYRMSGYAELDDFTFDAIDLIVDTKQATVSTIQRGLKLGYARSAHILDQLEVLGVVGPFTGAQPRTIFISKHEWEYVKMKCTQ